MNSNGSWNITSVYAWVLTNDYNVRRVERIVLNITCSRDIGGFFEVYKIPTYTVLLLCELELTIFGSRVSDIAPLGPLVYHCPNTRRG